MPTTINLHRWGADTTAKFREKEHIEMAMYPTPEDRDASLAAWVLRVLANPDNAEGGAVLDAVVDQRKGA